MTEGNRIEVLVAISRNGPVYVPGKVAHIQQATPPLVERYDVLRDDGRWMYGVHPSSVRAIVKESA